MVFLVVMCQGMFDKRIPTCCLSWVLCPWIMFIYRGEWHHHNCRITIFHGFILKEYQFIKPLRNDILWKLRNTAYNSQCITGITTKIQNWITLSFSQDCTTQWQEWHSSLWFLARGKVRACEWAPGYPIFTGFSQSAPDFVSRPFRILRCFVKLSDKELSEEQ